MSSSIPSTSLARCVAPICLVKVTLPSYRINDQLGDVSKHNRDRHVNKTSLEAIIACKVPTLSSKLGIHHNFSGSK